MEVVAHRILWSVPIAGAVLLALGRTADVKVALRSPRTMAMAALTASLITVNWGIYVWAIAVDRTVETALGYYINPLMSIAMAAVFLGEKLSRAQIVAVGLAVLAVVVLTVEAGGLPWISLALATSFAIYGFLRKTLPIGPSQGFFLEVLILSVPSLAYVIWLACAGGGAFRRLAAGKHAAPGAVRAGDRGAADALRVRRQAAALLHHRHHAVHSADHGVPDRGIRLPRASRRVENACIRADLDRARPLFLVDVFRPYGDQGTHGSRSHWTALPG